MPYKRFGEASPSHPPDRPLAECRQDTPKRRLGSRWQWVMVKGGSRQAKEDDGEIAPQPDTRRDGPECQGAS